MSAAVDQSSPGGNDDGTLRAKNLAGRYVPIIGWAKTYERAWLHAERPVVILRLRAQEAIGSSFVTVLERYSKQLCAHGGKLMVAGVSSKVKGQLDRTEATGEILGQENVFVSTTTLGANTREAYAAAQNWLEETPAQQAE